MISLRRLMKMQHRRLHKKANMSEIILTKIKIVGDAHQTWISGRNEKNSAVDREKKIVGEFDDRRFRKI